MTIATPAHRPSSFSARGRRHAMVVPAASTWDGGMPTSTSSTSSAARTLRNLEPSSVVEDTGGDRKDTLASIILGALFGLTLTFGLVMGAQEESFEPPTVHSFSVNTGHFVQ